MVTNGISNEVHRECKTSFDSDIKLSSLFVTLPALASTSVSDWVMNVSSPVPRRLLFGLNSIVFCVGGFSSFPSEL